LQHKALLDPLEIHLFVWRFMYVFYISMFEICGCPVFFVFKVWISIFCLSAECNFFINLTMSFLFQFPICWIVDVHLKVSVAYLLYAAPSVLMYRLISE